MDDMELINNPNYTYIYRSQLGVFYIRYNPSFQKWDLGIEDEVFGRYETTIPAANNVYCQATGWYEWDSLDVLKMNDVPTDIYQWERIPNKG